MITLTQKSLNNDAYQLLTNIILNNGIGVIPTDTVYGFICLPTAVAIKRLLKIKRRPPEKSLLLTVSDISIANQIISLGKYKSAIKSLWPGPLTVIAHSSTKIEYPQPEIISPAHEIAVRVPDFPFLTKLLNKVGQIAVSTSVNRTGEPVLNENSRINSTFSGEIDFFVQADLCSDLSSTIIRLTANKPQVIRQGPHTDSELSPLFQL